MGTGEGDSYADKQLEQLLVLDGNESSLLHVVSKAEYISYVDNNCFLPYDYAMEKKWFATCYGHALMQANKLYQDNEYRIVKITVLTESLRYMFYVKSLDSIDPAYAADTSLLNKIVRRLQLV